MAAGLPTAILVEVEFTAGVWTDIASSVVGDSIEIRVGRESSASDIQPGTLSLTLDNADGQWTPDNPTSARYPNWVEGKKIRVRVTKGTTSTRFEGRIIAIAPDFPSEPSQSRVRVDAVDGLGDLASVELPNAFQALAVANASTVGFYPMNETSGNFGATDTVGNLPPLTIRRITTNGSVDFAAEDVPTGERGPLLGVGRGLWHSSPAFSYLPTATSTAIVVMARVTPGSSGEIFRLSRGPKSSATQYISVTYGTNAITLDTFLAGALEGSQSIPIDGEPLPNGGWFVLVLGNAGSGNPLLTVWAPGSLGVGGGTTTSATLAYDCLHFGGDVEMAFGGCWIVGQSESTIMPDVAQALTGQSWASADPVATFAEIARAASFGLTVSGSLSSRTSYFVTGGKTALDFLVDLVRAEGGRAYCTGATVVVESRSSAKPIAVALTVDAELDAIGGPTVGRAGVPVYTTVTAKSPTASRTARSATATGQASFEFDAPLLYADDLFAAASAILAAGEENRLRVSQLTVDLSTASNDLYASLWALTPGERVRLSNLPSTYFGVTYMDGYVEGWTERPGVTGYEVTFDLSPADAPAEGLWDDNTYGRWGFGDGVATNTSSATSSATSVQFQWTGGLTLSTSAGDYPLDLDWNGERITVNSAPAGGSSPQTLSITRGVAPTVARAHNAGETVDIWNAARWAM